MAAVIWETDSASELAQWCNHRHFTADLQASSAAGNAINFRTQAVTDGSFYIARSSGWCSVNVNRRAAHIRKNRGKVCTLYFPINRRLRYSQDGRSDIVEESQFFLLHGDSPSTVVSNGTADDPWKTLVVTLPEIYLLDAHICPRDYGGIAVRARGSLGEMAFSAFNDILRLGADLTAAEIRRLVRASLEIVSVAIQQNDPRRTIVDVRDEHMSRVLAMVESSLGEVGLTAEIVAQRCGISRRYLHMLFSRSGKSFSAFLWDRRLACSADALRQHAMAHHSIEQVAGYFGFRNASHFARLHKARFGHTPGETRRTALSAS